MPKDRLDDFDIFYQEIPSRSYLDDFEETEIEDLVDDQSSTPQGLNSQQVSRLAKDSIERPGNPDSGHQKPSLNEPRLFGEDIRSS